MEFQQPLTCKLLAELQFSSVQLSSNNSQYETGFKFDTCSTAYQWSCLENFNIHSPKENYYGFNAATLNKLSFTKLNYAVTNVVMLYYCSRRESSFSTVSVQIFNMCFSFLLRVANTYNKYFKLQTRVFRNLFTHAESFLLYFHRCSLL